MEENYINLIDNYTNTYKTDYKDIKKIVNYLRNFVNFLTNIKVIDNEDIMFKVVKDNTLINHLLEVIVNSIISNKKYRYLKNNPKLESLISIYCIINNIDIDKYEEEKEIIDYTNISNDIELDSARLYGIEIRKIPVLTYQEEITLGRRIKKGDKEALDKLITHNLRLADTIASRYRAKRLDADDLRQVANEGLIKAAKMFDPDKGYRFSTYATWWIRQMILRTIENEDNLIRIAVNRKEDCKKYLKLKETLWNKLGYEPTMHEMEIEYNLDKDYVNLMERLIVEPKSLDEESKCEEDVTLLDSLEDRRIVDFDNIDLFEEILKGIDISERDKDIIERRYKYLETGDMVALRYGITRQRVKQIEENVFAKILKDKKKRQELDIYREQYGVNKSHYINDMDRFNDIVNRLANRIQDPRLNSNLIYLFDDLDFVLIDSIYFILRYGFKMENIDIYKYNIIEKHYCLIIEKRINTRIMESNYVKEFMILKSNPNRILEELKIEDLYQEYLLLNEEKFERLTIEEKIEYRVNYYLNNINESRFIYILKESNFINSMIVLLILKYIYKLDCNNTSIDKNYRKYLERRIKSCIDSSLYKDEIIEYLNNKDLVLEELGLSSKVLVK